MTNRRAQPRIGGRPDRVALWAVFLALFAILVAATSAQAQTGGATSPGGTTEPTSSGTAAYVTTPFGSRTLRKGMRGDDVLTLNWILKSAANSGFDRGVPMLGDFQSPTEGTVKSFQAAKGLKANGVVNLDTRRKLTKSMKKQKATWYGPGLYGNGLACGGRLTKKTIGVAHKKLPCGTPVTFSYRGRYMRTTVIDRGPFRKGYKWDLTKKLAKKLGYLKRGTGKVRAAPIR